MSGLAKTTPAKPMTNTYTRGDFVASPIAKENFSKNLNYLMSRHDMTGQELAYKLDTTKSTVCRWRQGISIPRGDVLDSLANVFGVTSSSLFRENIINNESASLDEETFLLSHFRSMNGNAKKVLLNDAYNLAYESFKEENK